MNLLEIKKNCRVPVLGVVASLIAGSTVNAQRSVQIVAPREVATVLDGNSYTSPFETAGRFQQVYDSVVFSSSPSLPGGGFVRQLLFRVDAYVGHSFFCTLPNVQLNLSTTLKGSDNLSHVFTENVGGDDVTVVGPGPVLMSALAGGGVTGFDILFDFRDRPFYYNPAKGNLMVDIRVHQGFEPEYPSLVVAILDAFTAFGDPISSVYAQGSGAATNGQPSTLGLATQFVFDAIPKLFVSVQSTNLQIVWLLNSRRGDYQLEQTSDLGVDARWQPFVGTVVTNLSQNIASVTLPPEAVTGRFFRLAWQTSSSNAAGLAPEIGSSALITVPNKER